MELAIPKCGSLLLKSSKSIIDESDLILSDSTLATFQTVLDLGVTIDVDLTFTSHIKTIVGKAKQRVYLILKSFQCRDIELLVVAFTTYIRPILEYCSVIWSPSILDDIDLIEDVQRYYTKRLSGLWDVSYTDRLLICGLQSLELRRLIIDLVLVFKIVNNLVSLDFDRFFVFDTNRRTRGHNLKLSLPRCSKRARQNFFSIRIISAWNSLPIDCVNSPSAKTFKIRLGQLNLSLFLSRSTYDYD